MFIHAIWKTFQNKMQGKAVELKKPQDKCEKNDKIELVVIFEYKLPPEDLVHMRLTDLQMMDEDIDTLKSLDCKP